jgi:hypothetical protein
MGKVVSLPQTLKLNKEILKYADEYVKTYKHEKLISLPKEYNFYLKKYKRVYKIEKSNSELSWVLTIDDRTYGWDQKGFYVRRLKGYKFLDVLNDAIKKYPNEVCFFSDFGMEYKSNDPDFDKWFDTWFDDVTK